VKILKYSLITLFGILLIGGISCYFWLNSSKPTYEGTFPIPGLKDSVDVRFDNFGVPHIEAQNMHDLYMAFGYVHAQDRLFQMELLRRAGSGRLSEVLGKKLLKADVLLRTIGLSAYADSSAAWMEQHKDSPMYAEMLAYLEGVNAFLHNGPTPPEFSIIGIEKVDFTIRDMFCITGAMAFSFSQAQKTDPIMDLIHKKYGNEYLADIGLWHDSTETFIRDFRPSIDSLKPNVPKPTGIAQDYSSLSNLFAEIEAAIPYAPLEGSNSWVISPKKTTSGNVLFCNDTHIGYLLPQTWYEAHLKCNSFEMYGHYMAGIPFALVGRNEKLSWGVTMLLNDDMDFYREFPNPENPHQFKFGEGFEDCSIRKELIKIKSEEDTLLNVLVTRHGPIISGIFDGVKKEDPLSMLWTYTRCKNNTITWKTSAKIFRTYMARVFRLIMETTKEISHGGHVHRY
jgi:penicillin amidase